MDRELQEMKNSLREKGVTEQEFWTSKPIKNYFTDMAKAVLERYGTDFQINVNVIYKPDDCIAYTTFNEIVLNAACKQVAKVVRRENKFLYLKGLLAHELSHIIYMDKPFQEKYFNLMRKGMFVPRIPNCGGAEKPVVEALKDSGKACQVVGFMQTIINILEDGYGENTYLANYYGSMVDGMVYMRKEFLKDMRLTGLSEKALNGDEASQKWGAVCDIMLCYSLYHKMRDEGDFPKCRKVLDKMSPIIDRIFASDFKERINCANEMLVAVWDYIEPFLKEQDKTDQQQNGQQQQNGNQQGSGQSNGTQQTDQQGGGQNTTQCPGDSGNKPDHSLSRGNTKPLTHNPEQANFQNAESNINNNDSISSTVEDLQEDVLDEMARRKLEEKRLAQANAEANEGKTCGCKVVISRDIQVADFMIKNYENYDEALEVSRRIQRAIKQQLEDRRKGGKRSGLYIGRKVEVRQTIRHDGKCFYNNTLPANVPRICVLMVIDESTSMNKTNNKGLSRISAARTAAVIVEDFCRSLEFPVCIFGSTAEYLHREKSELTLYSSFNSTDKSDKYRLMAMTAKACNRDGAAFAYGINELLKRPEEIKIMFMVSDGKPNASNYGGQSAKNELMKLNEKARRSGIIVFAAAIGDDKPQIEDIYGDSFLDITNLDAMPKIFTDKIKSFIKR